MEKKENQRIQLTKRMLQEGLLQLLQTKPLDGITVTELCRVSGINRATFYRHYKTIHDVQVDLERDFIKHASPSNRQPRNLSEAKKMLEGTCSYIYEHAETAKLLFLCSTDEDMTRRTNELFQSFVELHKNEPTITDMDRESLRMIFSFMSGGGYNLLRQWILEDVPKTPQEITDILFNIIYSIAQSSEGHNTSRAVLSSNGR